MAITDTDDNTTGGGGGGTPKKKTPPAKYKQMVKRPDSDYKLNGYTDGSNAQAKVSDKAAGLSGNYYPGNSIQTGPAIPTQKRSQ